MTPTLVFALDLDAFSLLIKKRKIQAIYVHSDITLRMTGSLEHGMQCVIIQIRNSLVGYLIYFLMSN